MTSRHLPAGEAAMKRRLIGQITLLVWSDESVKISWTAFPQGTSSDGCISGFHPADEAPAIISKRIAEIVEDTRNDDDL
jgi:hypothetical protein